MPQRPNKPEFNIYSDRFHWITRFKKTYIKFKLGLVIKITGKQGETHIIEFTTFRSILTRLYMDA